MATGLLFLLAFRPVDEIDLGTAEFYQRSLRNLRRSVSAPGPPSGSGLLAGASRVSIAPPLTWDVPLGGNRRALVARANGTHPESVFVRSIALSNGGRKLILTSADILTWNRELAARTLELIRHEVDLASREFLPVATHTHAGPGGYWQGFLPEQSLGPYERRLFDHLARAFADSAIQAWHRRQPVVVHAGRLSLDRLVGNRVRGDGVVNSDLSLVRFERIDHPSTIDLLNFSAHPTLLLSENRKLSGDYPGRLARMLETEHRMVVFTPGTIGDQYAAAGPGPGMARATRMANGLRRGLDRLQASNLGHALPLEAFEFEITLPPVQLRGLQLASIGSLRLRDALAARLLPHDLRSTTIQAARIGPIALLGAPADLSTSVAAPILEQARAHGLFPLFISMAEDWVGYVMTDHEYRTQRYKSKSQMHGPVSGPLFGALYADLVDALAARSATDLAQPLTP